MSQRSVLAALLLIALVVAVYTPGLRGGFAFDDYHAIVENPALELHTVSLGGLLDAAMSAPTTGPLARPLAMLSFAANRSLSGLDPLPYKLTNLAIHLLNAVLLLVLMRLLLPRLAPRAPPGCAWLIVALWALHPINLTAVLYVVQRMTSLSATFVLAALALYTFARLQRLGGGAAPRGWPLVFALSAALAVLCKETALSLLFYVMLIEFCAFAPWRLPLTARTRLWLGLAAGLMLVLGGLYFLRVAAPGYAGREFTLSERLLSEARVMLAYLRLLLVPAPAGYTLFHDDLVISTGLFAPPSTAWSLLTLAVLSGLAFKQRTRRPYLTFGWAWFVLGHAMEGTVLPLELMHEHRNYLPSLGIICALVPAVANALEARRRLALGKWAAWLALTVCGLMTAWRASLWQDPALQIETELVHHQDSPRLWYEAGRLRIEAAHGNAARFQRGIAALERAAQLAPIPTLPLSALLKTATEHGSHGAVARLIPVIVAAPRESVGVDVFRDLVICQGYGPCRKDAQAVQALGQAMLARPDLSAVARNDLLEWLAVFYARILADPETAITVLRDVVAARAQDYRLRVRLAEAYASAGHAQAATSLAREAQAALPWHSVLTDRPLRRRLAKLLSTTP